jgi:AcrR family transcriptional regulator
MRTLAARLGVRASSLYRHFPDRSSIEKALAVRAAEQLLERMRQSVSGLNGERAVFAASRAYLDYATADGAFYDIMMQSVVIGAPPSEPPTVHASSKQLWDFFLSLISDATKLGDDAAGAAALWSFLHGFAVLSRSGQLGETPSKLTFARGTQALVRGLSVADAEAVRTNS